MSDGTVHSITSSEDFDSTVKQNQLSVVWVFDSDGANRGFGKKYEEWLVKEPDVKGATFYKAGSDDIKDAIKANRLTIDAVAFFKNGEFVKDDREDHNLIYNTTKSLM